MICFCFNIAKRPLRQIHAQAYNRKRSLPAFAQRTSFVSVFNKVENTLLPNSCLAMCAVFSTFYEKDVGFGTMCTNQIYKTDEIFV